MSYRACVVGCGRGGEGSAGCHSIGYFHAESYREHPDCSLVAGVDLNADNLAAFREYYGVGGDMEFASVLAEYQPDIVSICTYVGSHRQLVEQAVAAGVRGIWCEKPFALSMDDARAMISACENAGVALVLNYQRRFLPVFLRARDLLQSGVIGDPVLLMSGIHDWDAMEWGCHWLDMFHLLQGGVRPEWAFGQVQCSGEKRKYGHVMEEHSVSYIGYENGARGLLDGGKNLAITAAIRVCGSVGMLDIHEDGSLRWWNDDGVHLEQCPGSAHVPPSGTPGFPVLDELVCWLRDGTPATASAAALLDGTAAYLAVYASAATGQRIDWPLGAQATFPLETLLDRRATEAACR